MSTKYNLKHFVSVRLVFVEISSRTGIMFNLMFSNAFNNRCIEQIVFIALDSGIQMFEKFFSWLIKLYLFAYLYLSPTGYGNLKKFT